MFTAKTTNVKSTMVVWRRRRPPRQVLVLLVHIAVVVFLFLQQQPHVVESLASSPPPSSLSSYSTYSNQENGNNINIMFRPNSSTPVKLRVVSYNVLSSHLASPSHFTTLNPDHLDAEKRLPMILAKLQDEITCSNNNKDDGSIVVCCLQEVSYDWAGELHTFFAQHNYHLVTGLYGKWYNGYMGVALAWPNEKVNVVNVDIARLADTRRGGWPKNTSYKEGGSAGIVSSVVARVQSLLTGSIQTLSLLSRKVGSFLLLPGPAAQQQPAEEETPPDHWALSANRHNVLLTATLQCKTSGRTFCVANYHMPCAYYCPMAMTIHADLCAAHVQRLAAVVQKSSSSTSDGDNHHDNDKPTTEDDESYYPYVLAGDFNIKPSEPVYRLLTSGKIDANTDATFYPTPTTTTSSTTNADGGKEEQEVVVEWAPSMLHAMKSAYAEHDQDGKEPDFTNYARIKEEEPFIDTLDFIFYGPPTTSSMSSSSWKVTDVAALPSRKDAGGPFPNLDRNEPSDHVLIAATLELQ